jgi:hypothetical protein
MTLVTKRLLPVVVVLLAFGVASSARTAHQKHHKRPGSAALASMGAQPKPSIFGVDAADFDSSSAAR